MPYTIEKVEIWSATVSDRVGALDAILEPLAAAGANLQFVLGRRSKPGEGIVFLAPLKGAAVQRAAKKTGLAKDTSIAALRIEGPDKAGLGAKLTRTLAEAGVNIRGFVANAIGRKMVLLLALDSAADAAKARDVIKKALGA